MSVCLQTHRYPLLYNQLLYDWPIIQSYIFPPKNLSAIYCNWLHNPWNCEKHNHSYYIQFVWSWMDPLILLVSPKHGCVCFLCMHCIVILLMIILSGNISVPWDKGFTLEVTVQSFLYSILISLKIMWLCFLWIITAIKCTLVGWSKGSFMILSQNWMTSNISPLNLPRWDTS